MGEFQDFFKLCRYKLSDTSEQYRKIVKKLTDLKHLEIRKELFCSALISLIIWFLLVWVGLILEMWIYVTPRFKLWIVSMFLLCPLIFFTVNLLYSLLKKRSLVSLARRIENHFPDLRETLIASVELFARYSGKGTYSDGMLNEIVRSTHNSVSSLDLTVVLPRTKLIRLSRICAAFIIFSLLIINFYPETVLSSAWRLAHTNITFSKPARTILSVFSRLPYVVEGDDVELEISVIGVVPETIQLVRIPEGGTNPVIDILENPDRSHLLPWKVKSPRESFEYYIISDEAVSDHGKVRVIKRPVVRTLTISIVPPPYTVLPEKVNPAGQGDIYAYKGSKITLDIEASKELDSTWVVLNDESIIEGTLLGKKTSFVWVVKEEGSYCVNLRDTEGISNRNPVRYVMRILEDENPEISILAPPDGKNLVDSMKETLTIQARDDFGFTSMAILYRIGERGGESEIIIFNEEKRSNTITEPYVWDVNGYNLVPGDVITYRARITDNDRVNGPKTAYSYERILRYPSIEKIFREIVNAENKELNDLKQVLRNEEDIMEKLDKIRLGILKQKNLDWQGKNQMENIAESRKMSMEKFKEVSDNLEKVIDKMREMDLSGIETLMKMEELRQLVRELASEEYYKIAEELRKKIEALNPQKVLDVTEKFDLSHKDLTERLDRVISLFKMLKAAQELDVILKKLGDYSERQQQIRHGIKSRMEPDDLIPRENRLTEDMKGLESDIEEFTGKMEDIGEPLMTLLDSLAKSFQVSKKMKKISNEIQNNENNRSIESSLEAEQDLAELEYNAMKMKDELSGRSSMNILGALTRYLKLLLALSEREEELTRTMSKAFRIFSDDERLFGNITESNLDVYTSLFALRDSLASLSGISFFIKPEILSTISMAGKTVRLSVDAWSLKNQQRAKIEGFNALSSMNNASIQLLSIIEDIKNSMNIFSKEGMREALDKLGKKQKKLNDRALALSDMENLTEQQLLRMVAEQNLLRQIAEETQNKLIEGNRLKEVMEELAAQMEDVVDEINKDGLTRRVMERQVEILTRLLEARESIFQREKNEKRKAETAEYSDMLDVKELPENLGNRPNTFAIRLKDAMNEGYSDEYKALIRLYFESLDSEKRTVIK